MQTAEQFQALAQADPAAAAKVLASLRRKLWVPHDGGQRAVLQSDARFRLLRAGRRWGKTQLAAHEVIIAALRQPGSMVWWVSNSDKNVRRGYRAVLKQLPRELLAKDPPSEGANDRILNFRNGSSIEMYTAGTPDSLAGEGVDFLVIDEAALIPEHVWFQLLRPTLSSSNGRGLIISTPRGRNWFWKLCKRGERGGEYESFHFPSSASPYTNDEDIEDARDTLPDLIFRQEYLAEFVANAASMFTLTDENIKDLMPPEGHVVLGIDLAKKEDWTVISGCNADTRLPCHFERMNEISWPIQEERILEIVSDLESDPNVEHVTVVVDSTGVGDVVYDHLDDMGLDVLPFNFGGGLAKERAVRLLAAELEHKRAFILSEMVEEFEHYEYSISDATGRYKFEASVGHDDMVAAKLLETWGVVHEAPPDVQVWDPLDEQPEDALAEAVTAVAPDSTQEIMRRPEVWSSYQG